MNIVITFVVVLLVTDVKEIFGGRNNRGNGRGRGPGFKPLPPSFRNNNPINVFPECDDFFQQIHEKVNESDRNNGCQKCSGQSRKQCVYEKFLNARLDVPEQPSEACTKQVNDFLAGVPLSTTTSFSTTTVLENTSEE